MTTDMASLRRLDGSPGRPAADLNNRVFGHLMVLNREGSNAAGSALWRVMCCRPGLDERGRTLYCGRVKVVRGTALAHGQMQSCGCARLARGAARTRRKPPSEMQGEVFGKLTCLRLLPSVDKNQGVRWLCVCECGHQKIARAKDLRNGNTKSCGCLARRGADWRQEPERVNNQAVGLEVERVVDDGTAGIASPGPAVIHPDL